MFIHQYIERHSGKVVTERLFGDRFVRWLYGPAREKAPVVFKALTSARASRLLSYYNFDRPRCRTVDAAVKMARALNIDLMELSAPEEALRSARALFERRIDYRRCRPMPDDPYIVVAPADAKVLVGSLTETALLFIKEKFFAFEELLGYREPWVSCFRGGDFAVFRLTPEKYHYNHAPVTGNVKDFYELSGGYHSCNPHTVATDTTPCSKNRRMVTIIDTEIPGGTHVGCVAMIEVAALMIGDIVQCYSDSHYDAPVEMSAGLRLQRGQPKSLFRPGSSLVVLLFEPQRVIFDGDILRNRRRCDASSRYSMNFQRPVVETETAVRASIGRRRHPGTSESRDAEQFLVTSP
jgi:phosphatidylserine decarboxylase